jgi:hypothetical protein
VVRSGSWSSLALTPAHPTSPVRQTRARQFVEERRSRCHGIPARSEHGPIGDGLAVGQRESQTLLILASAPHLFEDLFDRLLKRELRRVGKEVSLKLPPHFLDATFVRLALLRENAQRKTNSLKQSRIDGLKHFTQAVSPHPTWVIPICVA